MKKSTKKTLAEVELDSAMRIRDHHLENIESSRQSIMRQYELVSEHEREINYWQFIVDLEKEHAAESRPKS